MWAGATTHRGDAAKLLRLGDYDGAIAKYAEAERDYGAAGHQAGIKRSQEGKAEAEGRKVALQQGRQLLEDADSLVAKGDTTGATNKYTEAESKFRVAHDNEGVQRATESNGSLKKKITCKQQGNSMMDKGSRFLKKDDPIKALECFEAAVKSYTEAGDVKSVGKGQEKAQACRDMLEVPSGWVGMW
jgi:tetratricopeptide (TPR) repeat protein